VIKNIQSEIKSIAYLNNVVAGGGGKFFIDPLIENNYFDEFKNYNLLRYKYDYKIKTTNIIDLTHSEENILSQMRKGHKSDIKRALKDKDLQIDYVDKTSCKIDEALLNYKKIHTIDAGGQTRTDASWDYMSDWLYNGNAVLVLAKSNSLGKYISGAYILMYKYSAYYGSYATIDANLNNAVIGHLIQWHIIKYLKEKGIKEYETGWNYYGNDEKLLQISKFKAGFGGKEKLLIEFISEYT
jgi:lipid II:glycine glycyltransferase (peptidoglycan interpeptide bridge formation enzyme)